ncbi:hypothetical protein Tco_0330556, partial [Tanacetum coccineum]
MGLAFTISTLECVTIGCCEVGGCGGVGGGELGVISRQSAMREVKAPISAMIVRVPEKDRWYGTRGKFVRWKGVRVTKASKRAKMGVR